MNTQEFDPNPMTLGQLVALACMLEVTAPKPGNVHRGADFDDTTFVDFSASAVAIGPVFENPDDFSLGELVLKSIKATRAVTSSNTNLGLVLLIAPLAKAARRNQNGKFIVSRESVQNVLAGLTPEDASQVYAAIRIANPGGLGSSDQHDISDTPPNDLLDAMSHSKDRDMIARQYCSGFEDMFESICPWLIESHRNMVTLTDAIVWTHVRTMSEYPDSLINRKCGKEVAVQSAALARKALDAKKSSDLDYLKELESLDFWLRSDHHRRNPGTTADLIGAALFVCLSSGQIQAPFN